MLKTAILLIDCPDRKGIVAAVANFLVHHDANIRHADQHQDIDLALFFMRVEFTLDDTRCDEEQFRATFAPLAEEFKMDWRLNYIDTQQNVAIFVSGALHGLADLLHRHQTGEFRCNLSLVVSNHPDAQALADFHKVPFHYLPVTASTKAAVEAKQLELLAQNSIDLVVLARYMQVLSPNFVRAYPQRIINVHHSFLPAFTGARPYHAAFARGVKLIGATSHYVTEVLDEGPIIEQDVVRVSQNDQLSGLMQKGRDLERLVLSRAVRWHLGHRILCYANKTVVFT
jgi:formyltetrahydrofolate deformylase